MKDFPCPSVARTSASVQKGNISRTVAGLFLPRTFLREVKPLLFNRLAFVIWIRRSVTSV